jgi:hypothetical protein
MERHYEPGWVERAVIAAADEPLPPPPPPDELDLENPVLAPPPEPGLAVGPFTNLVFGGTLDYRFVFPREMPEGMFAIHVNELFLTTNVGDHVSILAEQLLVTSDLGTPVGQDHGFAYVTLSELPLLPSGMAIRIGRVRLKYGVDAKLDAPANPLRTPEYRTIGQISDRAIELSGFAGPIDYVLAVAQGPDFVLADVVDGNGNVAGAIRVDAENMSRPVFARIGTGFSGSAPNVGLSGWYGANYVVRALDGFSGGEDMLFGGAIDRHTLVDKLRASADARWNVWRLKLAAEYTWGLDDPGGDALGVQAAYGRADLIVLPRRLSAQVQTDWFADGRGASVGAVGLGATAFVSEESWVRLFAQASDALLTTGEGGFVAGSQLLFAF